MNPRDSRISELISLARRQGEARVLAVPMSLVGFMGSLKGAIFLSQVVYWSDKSSLPEGWFYKSYGEWYEELHLSEYEVKKQVGRLVKMGLLETKVKLLPPRVHYKLNWGKLLSAFEQYLAAQKPKNLRINSEKSEELKPKNSGINSEKSGELKPENLGINSEKNEGSLNTELTTELTAELTAEGPAASPPATSPQLRNQRAKKHAAIEIYREVIGRYPKKGVESLIVEAGIETEAQQQFWREVIRRYIGCGWNPQNVVGMLEFYEQGRLPTSRKEASGGEKKEGGYRFATAEMFGLEEESEPEDGDS